jgi:hypothetical protein
VPKTNPTREFLRHTVNVPLEVETVAEGEPTPAEGVNVSFGGLAFRSNICPPSGGIIRLRIPTVEPVFEANARVAWCRTEEDGYLVGVQFMDSSDAFQSRMVQQVCSIENYRKEQREREGRRLSTQEAAVEWIEKYAGRFPDSETVLLDDEVEQRSASS